MEKKCALELDKPVLNPGCVTFYLRTQASYFIPLSLSFLRAVVTLCLVLSRIVAKDDSQTSVKPVNREKIATSLSADGPRTCQALGVVLSRHSIPKQVSLDCGIAVAPPKHPNPASDLHEGTLLSAHYFGVFIVLQLSEDVHVFESKHRALIQIQVYMCTFGPLVAICCQELFFLPIR